MEFKRNNLFYEHLPGKGEARKSPTVQPETLDLPLSPAVLTDFEPILGLLRVSARVADQIESMISTAVTGFAAAAQVEHVKRWDKLPSFLRFGVVWLSQLQLVLELVSR